MNLHKSDDIAEWLNTKSSQWNSWQWLANYTNGVITPGNIISVIGLGLVVFGLGQVLSQEYAAGALLIAVGRAFDILDGYLADATKTKSPAGEIVDSASDKIEIFMALVVLVIIQAIPSGVVTVMLAFSLWVSLVAITAKIKKYRLHPSLLGKLSTASAWASIVIFIFNKALDEPNSFLLNFGYLFFYIFVLLGIFAAFGYSRAALSNTAQATRLINSFEQIIAVYNPTSSNKSRAKARIIEMEELSGKKVEIIKTDKSQKIFSEKLTKRLNKISSPTLFLIGGGDGTVHDSLNIILNLKSKSALANIAVLPLWSGNANDFAFMLNGLSFNKKLFTIFSSGKIIDFKPLEITTENSGKTRRIYAICYASFGASAFAANQLDLNSSRSRSPFASIPAIAMTKEFMGVFNAYRRAPTYNATVNNEKIKIFEEAFTKGSRIAKINTMPVKLTDNAYYHAHQSAKHPLLSRRFVQVITGQKFGKIVSKQTSFTIKNSTLAQFDGEVVKISKNSKITVKLSGKKIRAVSMKLSK